MYLILCRSSRRKHKKERWLLGQRSRYGFSHFLTISSILHFMQISTILPLIASLDGQKLCASLFLFSPEKRWSRQIGRDLPHFLHVCSGLYSGNFSLSSIFTSLFCQFFSCLPKKSPRRNWRQEYAQNLGMFHEPFHLFNRNVGQILRDNRGKTN